MRTVIISPEKRWYDALVHALGSSPTSILHVTARGSDPKNRPVVALCDVVFVCSTEIDAHLIRDLTALAGHGAKRVVVVVETVSDEWEERAHAHGAAFVLMLPLRPRLLAVALAGLEIKAQPAPAQTQAVKAQSRDKGLLHALRDLSRLLTYSLDAPSFLRAYMLQLREVLRASRLLLYLRQPSEKGEGFSPNLSCSFTVGVDASVFENIKISLTDGIGQAVARRGQVIWIGDEHLPPAIMHELTVLTAIHAIPVMDHDGLGGILFLGPKIAGGGYDEDELTLVFHLMEEFGAASRNSRFYSQFQAERMLFSSVLSQMDVGCLVVNPDLSIAQINTASRLAMNLPATGDITFNVLPPVVASMIYGVIKKRETATSRPLSPPGKPEAVFRFSVTPLQLTGSSPQAEPMALVVSENYTQVEDQRRQDIVRERENLLMKMGAALSNEIRNAIMGLHTLGQMPAEEWLKPGNIHEFLGAIQMESKRLRRSSNQLFHLSREPAAQTAVMPIDIVASAIQLVTSLTDFSSENISVEDKAAGKVINADETSLAYALFEVLLNGLQAPPAKGSKEAPLLVSVRIFFEDDAVKLSFRDRGAGFPGGDGKPLAPFTSTKAAGVGLGLTVVEKIIREHGGTIITGAAPAPALTLSFPIKTK